MVELGKLKLEESLKHRIFSCTAEVAQSLSAAGRIMAVMGLSRCLVVVVAMLVPSSRALAWGPEGHAIVALIATSRLTPAAKAGVAGLLGKKELADIASWADQVRRQRDETGPWHYVDIPVEFATYDAERDSKNGNNVIDKIQSFAGIVNDHSQPAATREEALKFLVHFVGDIHQPMHCADRNDDKGGNFRLVWFPGEKKANNLHRIWDSTILDESLGKMKPDDYAKQLEARITEKEATAWSSGTPTDWANESHALAVKVCYNGIPVDGDPPPITESYLNAAEKIVDTQLERGGVRLASLLNRIFR